MAQYNEFAYIYDGLMQEDVDYDAWCEYIEKLFGLHSSEPDKICELACGTGNMTSRLEKRGYNITGVDISRDMLSVASEKLNHTQLLCSDMSHFITNEKYDAFLCMIDGMNYVTVPEAVERTFRNVRSALIENGVFIFDISTRHKLKNIIGNETFINSGYDVFYSWQNRYIEKYNMSDMLLNFFVRQGEKYKRFEERHLQRGYSEKEISVMLKRAGFAEITIYDELTFNPPEADSERIVFVCK